MTGSATLNPPYVYSGFSSRHRRYPLSPGPRRFKLSRQAEQGRLVPKASHKMDTYRQTVSIPEEWHRHARLPCEVTDRCERHKGRHPKQPLQGILRGRVKRSQRYRWLGENGCQPYVAVHEEPADVAGDSSQLFHRQQICRCAVLTPHLVHSPRNWLEVLRGRLLTSQSCITVYCRSHA